MTTVATKSIKITGKAHRKLKSMAALQGIFVHELVDLMVKEKVQRRNAKEWPLCASRKSGVTSADTEAQCCTNCGSALKVIQ